MVGVWRDDPSADGPRRSQARRWPNSPTATAASWSVLVKTQADRDSARHRSVPPGPCSTSPRAMTRKSKVNQLDFYTNNKYMSYSVI